MNDSPVDCQTRGVTEPQRVANAQKQGAIGAECTEASSATMFQELEQNAECRMQN